MYHKSKKLGTGSFGVVSLAICKTTGKRVAIKQVQLSGHIDAMETMKRIGLLKEISVFMTLPPHVSFTMYYIVFFLNDIS